MERIIKESLVTGLILTLVGLVLHYLYNKYQPHDLNNLQVYGLHLFIVGVVTHMLLEYTEVNKWYCKNGNACLVNK